MVETRSCTSAPRVLSVVRVHRGPPMRLDETHGMHTDAYTYTYGYIAIVIPTHTYTHPGKESICHRPRDPAWRKKKFEKKRSGATRGSMITTFRDQSAARSTASRGTRMLTLRTHARTRMDDARINCASSMPSSLGLMRSGASIRDPHTRGPHLQAQGQGWAASTRAAGTP